MGVYRLSSFVKKIGAFKKVNMMDEIQQYRFTYKKSPVIVIDGINFIMMILKKHNFDVIECRLLDYVEALKNFVNKFKELSCFLVFFFDGANWMQNIEKCVRRRKQHISENCRIFDWINQYQSTSGLNKVYYLNNIWALTTYSLLKEGCEVKFSFEDCDSEINFYSKDNNCLGILANDSDFFINATCNVYCSDEFDFESMQVSKFDRNKLLEELDLKEFHLPLFATLVGNDVVTYGFFDYQIKGRISFFEHFKYVATYIKTLNMKNNVYDTIIRKISSDFGIVSDEDIDRLQNSLESYRIKPPCLKTLKVILWSGDKNWNAIVNKVFSKYKNGYANEVYSIIFDLTYQGSVKFEDFRENDLPPFYVLTEELRRKIYGILLFEKPGKHIQVMEMVVNNPFSFSPTPVFPIFPKVCHPGLLTLWESDDLDLNKRILLADVFGVDHKELIKIPKVLLVPALTLNFLCKKAILHDWEIQAFVLSAILTSSFSPSELSRVSVSKVQSRNVRVCTLVFETYELMILMLEALCGHISHSEYFPMNYQYGAVYHIVYKMMRYGMTVKFIIKSGFSVEDHDSCEEQFQCISSFVFGS